MRSKYHILWIDDEWETMTSFMKYCLFTFQMELHPFKIQKKGLDDYAKRPDFYEAVILDARGLNESTEEFPDVNSLQNAVMRIKEQFPNLPYFISTGQPSLLNSEMFKSFFPHYYEKNTDDEKLCQDIINTIENAPNRQIVNKYPELFSKLQSPIYEEMLSIIKIHGNREFGNADVFNKIRKVLDWIMQTVSDYGLLATPFTGTNLNDCSRFLGNAKLNEYIPVYIQRNLFSLVTLANEGSHRQITDKAVKDGTAPFLVSSTIFELMNVLMWVLQLPKDTDSKDKIDKIVCNLAFESSQKINKK